MAGAGSPEARVWVESVGHREPSGSGEKRGRGDRGNPSVKARVGKWTGERHTPKRGHGKG